MVNAITSGDTLSVEQLKTHSKIYAGPGAGKTYFLVENVKNIINYEKVIYFEMMNLIVNIIERKNELSMNMDIEERGICFYRQAMSYGIQSCIKSKKNC